MRNLANNLAAALLLFLPGACSSPLVVSVNQQAVYDPNGRLLTGEMADPNLQGCVNLAMQQQNAARPAELAVLSCANAEIGSLVNIGELSSLRFLDLANNNLSNITPLESLPVLSGINLLNNQITDISPLFNMPGLSSVNLEGNEEIPCDELAALREMLGSNLSAPAACVD